MSLEASYKLLLLHGFVNSLFPQKNIVGLLIWAIFTLITSKLPGILNKNNLLLELGKEFLLLTTVVTSAFNLQFVIS